MRLLKLLWAFLRSAIQQEVAYRADFFGNILRSALGLATTIVGVGVIFSRTETLAGWSLPQVLVVLGVFHIVGGIATSVLSPSLGRVVEEVRLGTFDYVLVKPVPSLFIASTRRFVIWHLADVILGAGLLVFALNRLGSGVSGWGLVLFLLLILSGVAIVYSLYLALTTLVFWFVRVENLTMIFHLFFETGRYPVEIYPFWLRQALTFVIPVAFITTVPAQVIAGREPSWLIWAAPVVALVSVVLSSRFWLFGISRYSSASS